MNKYLKIKVTDVITCRQYRIRYNLIVFSKQIKMNVLNNQEKYSICQRKCKKFEINQNECV